MIEADHAARRARLGSRLAAADVDGLLVTSLVNVRYLSGFSGSNAALFVPVELADDPLLATDGRYVTQAAGEAPHVPLLEARDCASALLEQVAGRGLRRVGVEGDAVTIASFDDLRRSVPGVELVPLRGEVEALRRVKDGHELALLREACELSCLALEEMLGAETWIGRTERDIAATLELRMRRLGADAAAFETIVGAGPNAAIPHHQPTDRLLAPGDLVVVDFGARVGGYHADMTRTFVVGSPAAWQREIFDLVRSAQRAGRAAARAGARCADVDASARDLVCEAGRAGRFGHGLGHGVGLEIHEAPLLGPGAPGTIERDVPVTVEPGVYLPGRGGVRIEDTLVVTDDAPDVLTTTSRELQQLV